MIPLRTVDPVGHLEDLEWLDQAIGDSRVVAPWETCPSPFADGLDPRVVSALARYQLPWDVARQRLLELMRNLHRLNVLATYRALEST